LTNFGASAEHSSFAASIASSIATSTGMSPRLCISWSATRRMLRSSGAIRSSVQPTAWRSITASSTSRSRSVPSISSLVNALASRGISSSSGLPVTSRWYSATTAARR
jgi:hypothetical protein